jgi:hypothetical protein
MYFLFVGRFASIVLWVTVFSNITNLTQKKKKKSADWIIFIIVDLP